MHFLDLVKPDGRHLTLYSLEPLAAPAELLTELPLPEESAGVVIEGRNATTSILAGVDDRLLVVVGPCSVHDVEAANEYATRLAARAKELHEDLLVVMRVYFEKPRTTTGWKGLINDPHLDDSGDVNDADAVRGARARASRRRGPACSRRRQSATADCTGPPSGIGAAARFVRCRMARRRADRRCERVGPV